MPHGTKLYNTPINRGCGSRRLLFTVVLMMCQVFALISCQEESNLHCMQVLNDQYQLRSSESSIESGAPDG